MTAWAVANLLGAGGSDLGATGWHRVGQPVIDEFATLTGDDQWIHVDPVRAAEGPFGQTVAHGYLLLSLVPMLLAELLEVSDARLSINYGIDRVRFTAPVTAGSNVRLQASIADASLRSGGILLRVAVSLELEGAEKPALVGEVLLLTYGDHEPADPSAG